MIDEFTDLVVDRVIAYTGKKYQDFNNFDIQFKDFNNIDIQFKDFDEILDIGIETLCCDFGFFLMKDGPETLSKLIGHRIIKFYECEDNKCKECIYYNYDGKYEGCECDDLKKEDMGYLFELDNGDHIHILHRHISNGYYHGYITINSSSVDMFKLPYDKISYIIYDQLVSSPKQDIQDIEI